MSEKTKHHGRANSPYETSRTEEIKSVFMQKPHIVLLGAGATKAAVPFDRSGKQLPLLREIAADLNLRTLFPGALRDLAESDFEGAYSRLLDIETAKPQAAEIENAILQYFSQLELPPEPTLYDALMLSLREKDAIFTFNWDPFLIQTMGRLARHGARRLPKVFFLHGNVAVGYCERDRVSGCAGALCSKCGQLFTASRLLFPVEKKNYQDGGFIEREWQAVRFYLANCFMLTIFGYSAPNTDVEAKALLKSGWGDVDAKNMEQTEIICRPGADRSALKSTWSGFIHSHHFNICESFWSSWIANHPRRTDEAHWNQYYAAKFIDKNPIPQASASLEELVVWYEDLYEAEQHPAAPPVPNK